jgi:hypothetical protein
MNAPVATIPTTVYPVHMLITPELAAQWMKHNTFNRPLKHSRVKAYGEDMLAGRWKETGESIKLTPDGTLLDGQNRLQACIEANTPFTSWVMFNVPPESFVAMDSGATRKPTDVLSMAGEKSTFTLSAVLAGVNAYLLGSVAPHLSQGANANAQGRLSLLNEFPEIRDSVSMSNQFGLVRTPIALLHFFGSKVDPEGTKDFLEGVRTGAGLATDSPALLFRERLYERRRVSREGLNTTSGYRFAIGVKALDSYLTGTPRKQLVWKFPTESFPALTGDRLFGSRKRVSDITI